MKVKKISETLHCGKLENQMSRTGTLLGGLAGLDGTSSVPLWQGVDFVQEKFDVKWVFSLAISHKICIKKS